MNWIDRFVDNIHSPLNEPPITYHKIDNNQTDVMLEKEYVGSIVKIDNGKYQYWPKDRKCYANPNDIKNTIKEVKDIIEGN